MHIKAKAGASRRTKNRVNDNGPEFVLVDESNAFCLDGKAGVLVHSASTDWFGWLPTDEINMEDK